MHIFRYYDLESKTWKNVRSLEDDIKKRLLNNRHNRKLLTTDIEDIAYANLEDVTQEIASKLLYDSDAFDVPYKSTHVKKRSLLFDRAKLIGVKLVVSATPYDFLQLEDHLGSSGMEVVGARTITKGIFEYRNRFVVRNNIETYEKKIKNLLEREFPKINFDMTFYELDQENSCSIELTFSGEIEQLFGVREYILNTEEHEPEGVHSVSFLP
jgi:hypothetical protein